MKRWLLGIGIGVASLLGVLLIAVGVLALLPAGTRAIRGEESIAEVRSIELGGFPQTVLTSLVEEWASRLQAPQVEIVWFENAGHFLAVEAPEEFQQRLVEKLLPLARNK